MINTDAMKALKFLRKEKRLRLDEIRELCAKSGIVVSVPSLCQITKGKRPCNDELEKVLLKLQAKHSKQAYAGAMR
jgi:transcriptional regulator with XRE-family HTH domain